MNTTPTWVGTPFFVSLPAANRYYAVLGFTPGDVSNKLMDGEIRIMPDAPNRFGGKPVIGHRLIDQYTRWAVQV